MNKKQSSFIMAGKLPAIVFVLCLIQPLLDVLSYWLEMYKPGNGITLILRFIMLVLILVLGYFASERKKAYLIFFAALAVHAVGHGLTCLYYGYGAPIKDFTNLIRIYQFPAVTIAFISFLKAEKDVINAIGKGFCASLGIIILVAILATLTGTDPHTYANKGVGLLGWFVTPSAQSAILSMLVPVVVAFTMEKNDYRMGPSAIAGLIGFGMLYLFATRLSFAALLGSSLVLSAGCLLVRYTQKLPTGKLSVLIVAFAVAAVLLMKVSPMTENNVLVSLNAEKKQEDILELVSSDEEKALRDGLSGEDLELARLRSAYEKYLPGVTGRFGLERTARWYDYSVQASDIAGARLQKIAYCSMLLEEQPLAVVFGMELGDMYFADGIYDAENDFHGIFYLCGGVGLALLLAFIGFFIWRILRAIITNYKKYITVLSVGYGAALACGLVHAFFTAGVLRRPNASFYLSLLLAVIYTLSALREDKI